MEAFHRAFLRVGQNQQPFQGQVAFLVFEAYLPFQVPEAYQDAVAFLPLSVVLAVVDQASFQVVLVVVDQASFQAVLVSEASQVE